MATINESEEDQKSEEDNVPNEEVTEPFEMFHHVNKTGVIYATARAQRYGFHNENPEVSIYFLSAYNMICLIVATSNDTILYLLFYSGPIWGKEHRKLDIFREHRREIII